MESIGERLREARESSGYTTEQASRDTHISRRFIESLEAEDFSGFPGETYTVGFLRNYATYLGLDPEEMVGLYRNLRIQEQPVPMNELLEDRKPRVSAAIVVFSIIIVLALGGIGYGAYWLITRAQSRANTVETAGTDVTDDTQETATGREFVLDEAVAVRWFSRADTITVPYGDATASLRIAKIDRQMYLETPAGVMTFEVGDLSKLDLDGDGRTDLEIQLNSVDTTASDRRVNIGLYKIAKAADERSVPEEQAPLPEGVDSAEIAAPVRDISKPVVSIRESEEAGPFGVTLSFLGRCLFRYQVNGDDRVDRFYLRGDTFNIDVDEEIRIWVSNAGAVVARIAGKQVEFGRQGEVASVRIAWQRDEESGRTKLKSYPVY